MDEVTATALWIGDPPTALKPRTTVIDGIQFPAGTASVEQPRTTAAPLRVWPRMHDDVPYVPVPDVPVPEWWP